MLRKSSPIIHLVAVVCLLMMALSVAQAGTVVASKSHPQATVVDSHGRRLRILSASGETIRKTLSPPGETLCRSSTGDPLLVRSGAMWAVQDRRDSINLAFRAEAPRKMNAAAALGGGKWAFLADGQCQGGGLIGARVYLSAPDTSGFDQSRWIDPDDRPQFLRTGSLKGVAALLVGVKTEAVFDAPLRLRPWIFSWSDASLRPLWLGTSFSRPFADAVFADCLGGDGDEICVTEATRTGRRQVVAYVMDQPVVEGAAVSEKGRFGSRLRSVKGSGENGDMICTWIGGGRGRLITLRRRPAKKQHLDRLAPALQTDRMARPAAWDVARCNSKVRAFVLHADGEVASYKLK